MIVVTIDLHSAITGKKKCLGTMIISNVGGTKHRGDYDVRVAHGRDAGNIRATWERPHRVAEVVNYPACPIASGASCRGRSVALSRRRNDSFPE